MKLRVEDDSVVVRLNRRDIARLAGEGSLQQALEFDQGLTYGVEAVEKGTIGLRAGPPGVWLTVPRHEVTNLAATDTTSIAGEVTSSDGHVIWVAVEKEFRRIHDDAGNPDLYPNPRPESSSSPS